MITFITYDKNSGLIESVQQTPDRKLPKLIDGKGFIVVDNESKNFVFGNPNLEYFYEELVRRIVSKDTSGTIKEEKTDVDLEKK